MRRSKNLHVPLPDELDRELRSQAKRIGVPATVVAREAIEAWLERRRRHDRSEAIAAYAREAAGSEADLDERLEPVGVEAWSDEEP